MSPVTGNKSTMHPSSSWVEPIAPLTPRIMRRSALENLCARAYPTVTFFFALDAHSDPLEHYTHLQQSLSRVLYRDEVLAGTLEQDERGSFDVAIPAAPHAGVDFPYRDLSRDAGFPDFTYLEKRGFPFVDGEMDGLEMLRPDPFPTHRHGAPVLVLQLTHVRGGLVLFIGFSHIVTDMVRSTDFCTQWSLNTRLIAEAASQNLPAPPIPPQLPSILTDISRLLPVPTGPSSIETLKSRSALLPNFKLIDPTDPTGSIAELQNFVPKAHLGPCSPDAEDALREEISGVWHFAKKDLAALHAAALQTSPGAKLSVMDVFVAFLWRRYFAAKYPRDTSATTPTQGLHGAIPPQSTVMFAINTRAKMTPPLPPNYMGAAVDLARVHCSSGTLLSGDVADLPAIATAVRQANAGWDEQLYMALLELSQQTLTSPGLIPIGPIDLLITDHRGFFALAKADWGPGLGQCRVTREPYVGRPVPAGEVVIMPGREAGDVEVSVSAERVVVRRLAEDAEMRRRGEQRFVAHDVLRAYRESLARSSKL